MPENSATNEQDTPGRRFWFRSSAMNGAVGTKWSGTEIGGMTEIIRACCFRQTTG
jgi:hypothetical protein